MLNHIQPHRCYAILFGEALNGTHRLGILLNRPQSMSRYKIRMLPLSKNTIDFSLPNNVKTHFRDDISILDDRERISGYNLQLAVTSGVCIHTSLLFTPLLKRLRTKFVFADILTYFYILDKIKQIIWKIAKFRRRIVMEEKECTTTQKLVYNAHCAVKEIINKL